MTYLEIVEAARARAMDFGTDFPTTKMTLYRRIEIRQQEIFSAAGRVNPDYFGVNTVGVLDVNGDVNLQTLEAEGSGIDPTTAITRVEIEDPGTHPTLQACDQVTIVTQNDPDAGISPRMLLRNFVLHGYKGPTGDMEGVTSVCIYYAYRPASKTTPLDGTETSELPPVYQELLVVDLTKWLLKQSISMDSQVKSAALAVLQEDEDEMQGTFLTEAADYAGTQVSRFGAVVGTQRV